MASQAAFPDRLVEWLFASMWLAWGVWLLNPEWTTFDNPQYAALKALAREEVWGAWSIGLAMVRMGALVINGHWRRTPILRLGCSMFGLWWWMTLIYLFVTAPQLNPAAGFSWYPVFIVFEAISCWRCAADAFHSDAFKGLRRPTPQNRVPVEA